MKKSPLKKSASMKKRPAAKAGSASDLIDARIEALGDWRGDTLSEIRDLIKEVEPDVIEAWKWRGTPVWEHNGMICTGETYKDKVKITFFKGAALKDPSRLFNSSLEGNSRRAIDFFEGDKLNKKALKSLLGEAVAVNQSSGRPPRATSATPTRRAKPARGAKKPTPGNARRRA